MATGVEQKEKVYADKANALYAQLMDLNIAMSICGSGVNNLMTTRQQLLTMHGVAADPDYKPGSAGAPPKVAAAPKRAAAPAVAGKMPKLKAPTSVKKITAVVEGKSLKSVLNEVLTKKLRRVINKDDVLYTTSEAGDAGYISTVSSSSFAKEYQSGKPCYSKPAAESAAARAALKAEFPSIPLPAEDPASGEKRKAGDPPTPKEELIGRQLLQFQITLMLGRTLLKGDLVYTTTEVAGSDPQTFKSTVTFPTWNKAKKFAGTPSASKKDAEASAAEVATKALTSVVQPKLDEHNARKAQKTKERIEKLIAKQETKRETA